MEDGKPYRVRALVWAALAGMNIGVGIRNVDVTNMIIGAWLLVMVVESWSPRARRVLNRPIGRR